VTIYMFCTVFTILHPRSLQIDDFNLHFQATESAHLLMVSFRAFHSFGPFIYSMRSTSLIEDFPFHQFSIWRKQTTHIAPYSNTLNSSSLYTLEVQWILPISYDV